MNAESSAAAGAQVAHLLRHESGHLVSTLTRIFGPAALDRAEDVVQEALLRALRTWSIQGVPDEPSAWLQRVARNRALDLVRRDRMLADKEDEVRRWELQHRRADSRPEPDEPDDDTLRMLLLCCHERLPRDMQVTLTLKTVSGFGVREIARALLTRPATIAQRVVRAKRELRKANARFELPGRDSLPSRLDAVRDVIYLVFNEGYESSEGDSLMRRDLVDEALRLARLLTADPSTASPESHALCALLSFQAARLDTRQDGQGDLILLEEQDRSQWDSQLIRAGLHHLQQARISDQVTALHLEAGLAACHATSPSFAATPWAQIVTLYDRLLEQKPSPVVRLNRAVACSMLDGPARGLAELEPDLDDPRLRDYPWFHAVLATWAFQRGEFEEARSGFQRALQLTVATPTRAFLQRRIADCEAASE